MHPLLEAFTSHVVAAGRQTMDSGWKIPPRTLEVHDLIAVESGFGKVRIGPSHYPMRQGTWALLPAGVEHEAHQDPERPLTLSVVHFSLQPETATNLLYQLRDPGQIHCPDPKMASLLISWVLKEFNRASPVGQLLANRTLDLLLALLLHQDASGNVADSRIAQAIALIQSQYNHKWTHASLGRRVGLSPDHFRDCFIAVLGISPHRYLHSIRLHHAKRLLRQSRLTLQEIATSTGWENASTFARTFKKHTGHTPGAYREISQKTFW